MTAADDEQRDLREALGKAIRLRRVELDLSRADLARESDVSYPYVSEIENGTKQASSKTLWRIARALGLEPHELMAAAADWEGRRAAGTDEPLQALGRARAAAARPDVPPAATAAAGVVGMRTAGSRWFHGGRVPAGGRAADETPADTAAPPELVEVLERLAAALDGVPDERAELALMLSLDERRTRRIVREELDRRGDTPRR